MKQILAILFCLTAAIAATAGTTKHVLFIGNSYTDVNNLPGMVADMALSAGDTLVWQSNTPGGCTFRQHCTNQSATLIAKGGWDVVVLQEQSQLPSFPWSQVATECIPYAETLVEDIYAANGCALPMFYMTWGRKNGDPQNGSIFPPIATYEGMDSLIAERYTLMADSFDAALCPVGRVWRHLRTNNPDIELYQSDNSHPSVEGSYAAAAAFYAMIFGRDPELITYEGSVDSKTAGIIRHAAKTVVYDRMTQWSRKPLRAKYTVANAGTGAYSVASHTYGADTYIYDDGNGNTISGRDATFTYSASGVYHTSLAVSRACTGESDTATVDITVTGLGIEQAETETDFAPDDEVTVYDPLGRLLYRGRYGRLEEQRLTGVIYIRNRQGTTRALCRQ